MSVEHPTPNEIDRLLLKAFATPPDPEVRTRHLAAMAAAFGQPTPAPKRVARHRRRIVIATTAASVLLGGSALAATGSLPGPAQDAIAKVAHGVGLDLPHSENPRAAQNGGKQFSDAKKAWTDCQKSGSTTCGAKPNPQTYVHPSATPKPSDHGNGKSQGDEHRTVHTPKPSVRPDHTPKPERTLRPDATPKGDNGSHGGHD